MTHNDNDNRLVFAANKLRAPLIQSAAVSIEKPSILTFAVPITIMCIVSCSFVLKVQL